MEFKWIVFDLDGTLVDSENAVLRSWQKTLLEYGYQFTLERLKSVLGITPDKALEKLEAKVDLDFWSKWLNNYQKCSEEVDFFPGVKEMLLSLKERGYNLGIVTSRDRVEYENYFRKFNLEELFEVIVLSNDTDKHKPDPEPLEYYLNKVNGSKDKCIYIGDMPTDIECANKANVTSGLVTWNGSKVDGKMAKMVFNTPEELVVKLC